MHIYPECKQIKCDRNNMKKNVETKNYRRQLEMVIIDTENDVNLYTKRL